MREGLVRIPSGCAISGIIDQSGQCFSGNDIIQSIAVMHDRSNGLGGGFAAYGIYPGYKDCFALHVFYEDRMAREQAEKCIEKHFRVVLSEEIPTRRLSSIRNPPQIWRYFIKPRPSSLAESEERESDLAVNLVMQINRWIKGAYVFSSGKNMGAFKASAFPEDVGEFYRLDELKGYLWTAHGRFPTNTPGWWGGAHPFTLLDWSVVHNGELSSYDANRRYVEMKGYHCTLMTDTEVITYLFDLLMRRYRLSLQDTIAVLTPPFWERIAAGPLAEKEKLTKLRIVYAGAMLNGPFSFIVATGKGMVALNDRLKLRPLVAAKEGKRVYVASEEAAIRAVMPVAENMWYPRGGEAVVALLEGENQIITEERAEVSSRTLAV